MQPSEHKPAHTKPKTDGTEVKKVVQSRSFHRFSSASTLRCYWINEELLNSYFSPSSLQQLSNLCHANKSCLNTKILPDQSAFLYFAAWGPQGSSHTLTNSQQLPLCSSRDSYAHLRRKSCFLLGYFCL